MAVFQHLRMMLQKEENIRTTEATVVLGLRLIATALLAAALTMHVRSLKVFKWEQSVSGGVLVTYLVANIGLALCAGQNKCEGKALQAFLCSTGAAMLLVNAGAIWQRWKFSNQATLAVAEILDWIGVPLKRQVKLKVILCSVVAVIYMLDLATVPLFTAIKQH